LRPTSAGYERNPAFVIAAVRAGLFGRAPIW